MTKLSWKNAGKEMIQPVEQSVITDGLVLYWDAGNTDSYPGTGTVVYDLSDGGNDGTFTSSVIYSSDNSGIFNIGSDASDSYITTNGPNLSSNDFTVMGSTRYQTIPSDNNGRILNSKNNNWLLGHWGSGTVVGVDYYYSNGWVNEPATPTSDTTWRIYTGTGDFSGDSYYMYINNSVVSGTPSGGVSGPDGFQISSKVGNEYCHSNLGFLLVYNRVLTTDEMTQNYNIFKDRYSL